MPSDKNKSRHSPQRVTLQVAGLCIPEEKKETLEKAADELANKVDAAGHLDPLDAQPATRFDPRC